MPAGPSTNHTSWIQLRAPLVLPVHSYTKLPHCALSSLATSHWGQAGLLPSFTHRLSAACQEFSEPFVPKLKHLCWKAPPQLIVKLAATETSATGFTELLQGLSTLDVKTHPLFLMETC